MTDETDTKKRTFKPGDITVLNSGGPRMTVVHTDEPTPGHVKVTVTWMTDDGSVQTYTFPAACLRGPASPNDDD